MNQVPALKLKRLVHSVYWHIVVDPQMCALMSVLLESCKIVVFLSYYFLKPTIGKLLSLNLRSLRIDLINSVKHSSCKLF